MQNIYYTNLFFNSKKFFLRKQKNLYSYKNYITTFRKSENLYSYINLRNIFEE